MGPPKGVSGLVAQLEERRLCEAEALGSNPSESITMHHARSKSCLGRADDAVFVAGRVKPCISFAIQTLTEFSGTLAVYANQWMAWLKR